MKDIEIAKNRLFKENLSLVAVRDGEVIREDDGKGIKPMLDAYVSGDLKDVSLADRIIGKAAAMLLVAGGAKELYTDLISDQALDVLGKSQIKVGYKEKCEYILNQDESDLCPIEKLSKDTDDVDDLIEKINVFINRSKGA